MWNQDDNEVTSDELRTYTSFVTSHSSLIRVALFMQRVHGGAGLSRPFDQPAGYVLVQDAGHEGLVGDAFFLRYFLKG